MTKPDYLDQLLDLASNNAGSDYKLAQLIGSSRSAVSDWRHGRKTCPAADVVLLAEVAGLKPEEWAARALISQYEGTEKGDKLFRILGKTLAVTGAVIASSGASAHQIFSHSAIGGLAENVAKAGLYFIRCILC